MSDATMVTVPAEDLFEAIAHVGALQEVLCSLEGGHGSALSERIQSVWTALTYWEQPDGDREYERHPMNVKLESRIDELAGEVLVQVADSGALEASEIAYRGARLLGDAREMREQGTMRPAKPEPGPESETHLLYERLHEASRRRRSFELIPGGAA